MILRLSWPATGTQKGEPRAGCWPGTRDLAAFPLDEPQKGVLGLRAYLTAKALTAMSFGWAPAGRMVKSWPATGTPCCV